MNNPSISICDYGAGNLGSVYKAFKNLGCNVKIAKNTEDILKSERLVVPGVGSFSTAMKRLESNYMTEAILEFGKKMQRPILGICLGYQIMHERGTEGGECLGLGLVDGAVTKLKKTDTTINANSTIPHVGFNTVDVEHTSTLFQGIKTNSHFYFVHSYCIEKTPRAGVRGITYHCQGFYSSAEVDNICGVQFHPEKSQGTGLKLLRNFVELF